MVICTGTGTSRTSNTGFQFRIVQQGTISCIRKPEWMGPIFNPLLNEKVRLALLNTEDGISPTTITISSTKGVISQCTRIIIPAHLEQTDLISTIPHHIGGTQGSTRRLRSGGGRTPCGVGVTVPQWTLVSSRRSGRRQHQNGGKGRGQELFRHIVVVILVLCLVLVGG